MDQLVSDLGQIVGPSHVLTGTDMAGISGDMGLCKPRHLNLLLEWKVKVLEVI